MRRRQGGGRRRKTAASLPASRRSGSDALPARRGTPKPTLDRAGIDRVIRRHLAELRRPGVMTVRPGFELARGWVTGRPAIVVTVGRKRSRVPVKQRLPEELEGIPVDVRQSTGWQRIRARSPKQHALLRMFGPPELQEPESPYERRVSDGKLLARLPKASHPAARAREKTPELKYTPAAVPLKAVKRPLTVLACASPDAGFTVLADFFRGIRDRLTVGMYDFTSGDLLDTLRGVLERGDKTFRMVLDQPALNQTANQDDDQTAKAILDSDRRAKIMWALTRSDPKAAKWIFPYAYHIKVAVRDGSAFWLSSGNWNVSNQPNFAAKSADRGAIDTADRDWHVVVMDQGLARLFEAYLEHDFKVAGRAQQPEDAKARAAIRAALVKQMAEQKKNRHAGPGGTRVPFTLGKPRLFRKANMTVQPLLTPDRGRRMAMYVERVLALIKSAKRSLYIQTQYVHPSPLPADRDFMLLVDAVAAAIRRGVDVRLITSQYEEPYLELMHEAGLSGVLRIQDRVHNKGIVVDSRRVLVSSQNWSAAGTLRNRDAGLIIDHAGIARYFEAIFLQDWEKRADVKLQKT